MFTAGGFLSRVWGASQLLLPTVEAEQSTQGQAPQVVPADSLTPSGMQVKDKKTKTRQSKTHKQNPLNPPGV